MLAASCQPDAIQALINAGADVDAKNDSGYLFRTEVGCNLNPVTLISNLRVSSLSKIRSRNAK